MTTYISDSSGIAMKVMGAGIATFVMVIGPIQLNTLFCYEDLAVLNNNFLRILPGEWSKVTASNWLYFMNSISQDVLAEIYADLDNKMGSSERSKPAELKVCEFFL